MPTVHRVGGFRFFFYSSDRAEPPHVHVERGDAAAKFWIDPVRLERSRGFARHEVSRLQRLVEVNRGEFLRSWNEYFNG